VDDPNRSWAWLYCNQLGWFFSGAPNGWPSITSRLTTPDSEARLCSLYFPKRFPMGITASEVHNETAFNDKYGGWNINTTNVFFANGRKDPWRAATVSSDLNYEQSTPSRPIAVADGGFHCSDLVMQAGQYEPTVQAVQNLGAAYIYKWLTEWYVAHPNVTQPVNATVFPDPSKLPTPSITPETIPATIVAEPWQTNIALTAITIGPSSAVLTASSASSTSNNALAATGTESSDNSGTRTRSGAMSIRSSPPSLIPLFQTLVLAWIFSRFV